MSIEERAAAAAELKATGKCNCTQSVVKVFEDKLPIDYETLMKLRAGYAAGTLFFFSALRPPHPSNLDCMLKYISARLA